MIDKKSPEYKAFWRFCNSLRCPLCNDQLDGGIDIVANLHCCIDNSEYIAIYDIADFNSGVIVPKYEQCTHYFTQYAYKIETCHGKTYSTNIYRINLDNHPKYRKDQLIYYFESKMPDIFKHRITEKELLNKFRLYNTFS